MFPFYFCISCCTHTPTTWGQLWKRDQIQHNYGNGLPFSSSPPHRILLSTSLLPPSLCDCESISGSLKTCQMCSDQCNGLRVHYIHSAPFYEVTSWRGLPAGALCRTVNQAWQRRGGERGGEWRGGGGGGGWMRRMEVSPSSTPCLVSLEEMHCGGENTHLCTDTQCTRRLNTEPVRIVKYVRTRHMPASSGSNVISQCTEKRCVCVCMCVCWQF